MARGDAIVLDDKAVRKAFRSVQNQLTGRGARTWPVATAFKKYKTPKLRDPWTHKGLDDKGRKGVWPSLEESTVRKKHGKRFETLWYSNKKKTLVPMSTAQKHWEDYMQGGGYMQKKRIPHSYRRKGMMVDSGRMKRAPNLTFSKKKAQFVIRLKGEKRGKARTHLEGASFSRQFTRRSWRGRGSKKRLYLTTTNVSWKVPRRAWAVFTLPDLKRFIRIFNKWFTTEFKRGA